jgi:hypothetical protein
MSDTTVSYDSWTCMSQMCQEYGCITVTDFALRQVLTISSFVQCKFLDFLIHRTRLSIRWGLH